MATTFPPGVVIVAAVSSWFVSALGSTQRTLNKLMGATDKLKMNQDDLSRRAERYGQISADVARRLRSGYDDIGCSMKKLRAEQEKLQKWDGLYNPE